MPQWAMVSPRGRESKLDAAFHGLRVPFCATKKACGRVPRSPGKNGLERTGLSMGPGRHSCLLGAKAEEMLSANLSVLLLGKR